MSQPPLLSQEGNTRSLVFKKSEDLIGRFGLIIDRQHGNTVSYLA